MFPKTVELNHKNSHAQSRACQVDECIYPTREGKPYCPDHVDEHPYVQAILDTLAERRAEEERVRSTGSRAVDLDGLTAKELVLHLSLHGARTVERLSRELQLEVDVLRGYVSRLTEEGTIALGRTNRGSTIVRLTEDE